MPRAKVTIPLPKPFEDDLVGKRVELFVGDTLSEQQFTPITLESIVVTLDLELGQGLRAELSHRNVYGEYGPARVEQRVVGAPTIPAMPDRFPILVEFVETPPIDPADAALAVLGDPTIASNV